MVTAPPVDRNAQYFYCPPVQDTSVVVPIPEADYSLSFIATGADEPTSLDADQIKISLDDDDSDGSGEVPLPPPMLPMLINPSAKSTGGVPSPFIDTTIVEQVPAREPRPDAKPIRSALKRAGAPGSPQPAARGGPGLREPPSPKTVSIGGAGRQPSPKLVAAAMQRNGAMPSPKLPVAAILTSPAGRQPAPAARQPAPASTAAVKFTAAAESPGRTKPQVAAKPRFAADSGENKENVRVYRPRVVIRNPAKYDNDDTDDEDVPYRDDDDDDDDDDSNPTYTPSAIRGRKA
ncbi:PREDICTED: predicted GPI-anchored protein 58 [Priapulus caudatus]|uniref:Predicted GPI-anchored protein 58 n=1 Tax=Priapulus caudatus TaxID=37621 RepID=A0ABM1EVZ4_PRICU|nr:PREDICTED: predicted GPI-anchored protein 58 [Priapulus caudatus]